MRQVYHDRRGGRVIDVPVIARQTNFFNPNSVSASALAARRAVIGQ
jgi:hypothetical protein